MSQSEGRRFSRRDFLAGSALVGADALLGLSAIAAEPPPEVTILRIHENPVTCIAPQLVAEQMLHAEGFTDVRYVRYGRDTKNFPPADLLAREVDITFSFAPDDIRFIDAGSPVVILAAVHPGCVYLIANDRIRSTRDLKGKTIGIDTDTKVFISMFIAYVGLDPEKDINWVFYPWGDWVPMFTEGKIDAFMCGPPLSVEVRRKNLGHALVNTTIDKPWSHHACCLIASTKEFVQRNPVATKRALRAILKGVDLCAREPDRVAQFIADRGTGDYDISRQALRESPFAQWREIDVATSMRFWALRLHDVGGIKTNPEQIIARGMDLRFLKEIKQELKA